MKKILISTAVIVTSLSLLAITDNPAWSDQAPAAATTPPPIRSTTGEQDRLQSGLAESEVRLRGVYRELQGAQELLQQAGKALYRAQADYQESSRIQRMLHNRLAMMTAAGHGKNPAQDARSANEWEIERYRAFAQNLDNERSKLQLAVESRDQKIASLERQLSQLQGELADTRASRSTAQQETLKSKQDLLQANILLEEARSGQIALTRELKTLKAANVDSAKFLSDTLAQRNHLNARLSSCNESLTRVRTNLAAMETTEVRHTLPETAAIAAIEPATAKRSASASHSQQDASTDDQVDRQGGCAQAADGVESRDDECEPQAPISLQGVKFRYDSAELTAESRLLLDQVATVLQQQPDLTHEVAGHTDAQGEAAYNLWLSRLRAESVRKYLIERGVKADRLIAVGYGGNRPIADNGTWEGLVSNRRVELHWVQ